MDSLQPQTRQAVSMPAEMRNWRVISSFWSSFNRELTRIKQMQEALNIPQLEELIHAAQQVIRPVYALTAGLNG